MGNLVFSFSSSSAAPAMFSEIFTTKINTHVNHPFFLYLNKPCNALPMPIAKPSFFLLAFVGMAETACSGGNSRWNPTKEQISMLESLYKQGIRTPSADQIQQITGRLKAYGTIEGKNVFYWFQNHKARQRQKQKQENLAYINRYLHTPQPVYPPPVVRGPYFLPQVDHNLGFYPQCPKVLIPCGSVKKNGRPSGKMVKPIFYGGNSYDLMVHNTMMIQDTENYGGGCNDNGGNDHHETLDLFPLHPTGVSDGNSTLIASPNDSFVDQQSVTAGSDEHHFFDFLSCQASTHESVSKQ